MTHDEFYNTTEYNNKKRKKLHNIVAVFAMYAMILVCLLFRYEWWLNNGVAVLIVWFIYLTCLIAVISETNGVCIFGDKIQRLRDCSLYCESIRFADDFFRYNVPVRNGDYLLLSTHKYLELKFRYDCLIYNVYSNYNITGYLLDGYNVLYTAKNQSKDDILYEFYKHLREEGQDILEVCNKFGDVRWRKSDKIKHISKTNTCIANVRIYSWFFLQFVVSVLPILFMLGRMIQKATP